MMGIHCYLEGFRNIYKTGFGCIVFDTIGQRLFPPGDSQPQSSAALKLQTVNLVVELSTPVSVAM